MTDAGKARQPKAFAMPGPTDDEKPKTAGTKRKPNAKSASEPRKRQPKAVEAAKVRMISAEEDVFDRSDEDAVTEGDLKPVPARKAGLRPMRWVMALVSLLVSIGVAVWIDGLVRTLFERQPWLGWATLGLAALLVLFVMVVILAEIRAIWRLRSIGAMREQAEQALAGQDDGALRKAASHLARHYAGDPRTASGRATLSDQQGEIIDGADLYALAEQGLLKGLDADAKGLVMAAARRVSVVTAVSPRAFVDIAYVLYENVRLIRAISVHYGGRSGFFGTMRLLRSVVAHLAVTGTVAIGDSLIQQLLGHGMASRLSARLGEGVINGLMTVRVGIAAIAVCRPAPFSALPEPKVSEFLNVLKTFPSDDRKTEQSP